MDAAETPPPTSTTLITTRPTLRQSTALWFWGQIRKIVVFLIGSTVIGFGIVLLVLPGPGWLVIFGGLALLATEFAWARWALKYGKKRLSELLAMISKPVTTSSSPPPKLLPDAPDAVTLPKVDSVVQFSVEGPQHEFPDALPPQVSGHDLPGDRLGPAPEFRPG